MEDDGGVTPVCLSVPAAWSKSTSMTCQCVRRHRQNESSVGGEGGHGNWAQRMFMCVWEEGGAWGGNKQLERSSQRPQVATLWPLLHPAHIYRWSLCPHPAYPGTIPKALTHVTRVTSLPTRVPEETNLFLCEAPTRTLHPPRRCCWAPLCFCSNEDFGRRAPFHTWFPPTPLDTFRHLETACRLVPFSVWLKVVRASFGKIGRSQPTSNITWAIFSSSSNLTFCYELKWRICVLCGLSRDTWDILRPLIWKSIVCVFLLEGRWGIL